MRTIRVALLDDHESWLEKETGILQAYSSSQCLALEITCFTSGNELMTAHSQVFDALFSDIEIGGDTNGIDFAQRVHGLWSGCQVVFVTNHLRYALDVYGTEHLWFVTKDQFEQRLPEIMGKLLHQMEERSASVVLTTTSHELVSLDCKEIVYLERNVRITKIHVADGTVYEVNDRIAALLNQLPPRAFARSHGSFAVNLAHVRKIQDDVVVTHEGYEVPLSRRFARPFKESYLSWADDHVA